MLGKLGRSFGRDLRRNGIDERLARIIRTDGIRDDALARMERVGCFGSDGFIRLGVQDGLGFCGGNFERGEIFDRAGPGELRVVECRIVRRAQC